jgi:hypothetical protein
LLRHRHCLRSEPVLSSSLHSLSFCLLIVAYLPAPDLGWLQSLARVLGSAPSRSHSSASAVLLLGPFLGLGGPRFFGLALVLLFGSSPHRLRLGAPHETFGLASVLLFGLALVLPLGSSVLHTKPAASVPSSASAVLGSSASLRCSSSAPRLGLGAPE